MWSSGQNRHKIHAMIKFSNLNVQMLIRGNSTMLLVRTCAHNLNILYIVSSSIGTYQCSKANYEIILCPNGNSGGSGSSIQWNGNKWAMSCDFPGNDMSNFRTRGEDCGGKCAQTSGCTHYAWNTYQGGTCWLKSGSISKSDAVPRSDVPMVCGVI